jgi:hypothetical protein
MRLKVDLAPYGRAVLMLFQFPTVMLAPLLMAVAQVLIFRLLSISDVGGPLAGATAGIAGLFVQLLTAFALGVSLIVADRAWRTGRSPFDQAWDEARRKAPDILLAALGFSFIIWVAAYAGSLIGALTLGFGSLVLECVALFFFIYTLPAAAIGGIPGGAALQISLERAKRAVPATIFVAVVYVLAYIVVPLLATDLMLPLLLLTPFATSSVVASLLSAFAQAIAAGYVALVLAKVYNDVSYGRARY